LDLKYKIISFTGKYAFLSNFYYCDIMFEDLLYPSAEHAYVAAKTTDLDIRKIISTNAMTPGEVKRFGRNLELRDNWEYIKLSYMRQIVETKFNDKYLMSLLNSTRGYELIEVNSWGDKFYGQSPIGVGRNELGKILMSIRDNVLNFGV
jgi:ribA/ribD-fused uncharacterized protein